MFYCFLGDQPLLSWQQVVTVADSCLIYDIIRHHNRMNKTSSEHNGADLEPRHVVGHTGSYTWNLGTSMSPVTSTVSVWFFSQRELYRKGYRHQASDLHEIVTDIASYGPAG